MSASKRGGVRPTHDWQLLLPLFEWPEQERYEQIRPMVLFDASVVERATEVGISASTLYRRLDRFAGDGIEGLLDAPTAKRKRLPPSVRRLIVDLKAEYPAFNTNEIANVVHACFGRRPDYRSVSRVLDEEPVPLKIVRNYPPYHGTEDPREGRAAIVELRLSGWSAKSIAGAQTEGGVGERNPGRRSGYSPWPRSSNGSSVSRLLDPRPRQRHADRARAVRVRRAAAREGTANKILETVVFPQRGAGEHLDARPPGFPGDLGDQESTHAARLPPVLDDHGDLCLAVVARVLHVHGVPDYLLALHGNDGPTLTLNVSGAREQLNRPPGDGRPSHVKP